MLTPYAISGFFLIVALSLSSYLPSKNLSIVLYLLIHDEPIYLPRHDASPRLYLSTIAYKLLNLLIINMIDRSASSSDVAYSHELSE